jgi:hypothetical protein
MDESSSGSTFNHSNSFFIGHLGAATGARIKLDFGAFSFGVIGELAWLGDSFDRKQVGAVNDVTYRDESYRILAGLTGGISGGVFGFHFDYYPWVQNVITYSDAKAENPFRKNDKLNGTGFGIGFDIKLNNIVSYFVTLRQLTYGKVEINGTSVTLPNSQYTTLVFTDVLTGLNIFF